MEYHMPSQFDQNGFNVLSPNVQSMMNTNGGVGYNPTPQTFMYNGENPYLTYLQNNQNNQTYNDYCNLGADASAYLQQAQQIASAPVQPQQQYQYYNPVYGGGYYNENYVNQNMNQMYNQLYDNGQISLSDYCYYNNGGINPNACMVNGNRYYQDPNDDWYGYATRSMQRRQQAQEEYEKEYKNQIFAWSACGRVVDNYFNRKEEDRIDVEKRAAYFNKLNAYRQACMQDEYNMDCYISMVRNSPRSTDPGYISPLKYQFVTHWNNYYHERNDEYPENYTLDDFFNKGIMNDMIFGLYAHDAKLNARKRKVEMLYNRDAFKNYLHQLVPSYDPVTETGLIFNTTIGGGISDIEIRLPEHLARDEYTKRKMKFIDSIFADNRANIGQAK